MMKRLLFLSIVCLPAFSARSQVNEHETGAWYMYFWNTEFSKSGFGLQGDIQVRKWNIFGDLEQLLLRGGLTYSPKKADIKFTLGYSYITSGVYGESKSTSCENRIYQEILMPQKVGSRFYIKHRLRYEQRLVENQHFRTRYRYALFLNVPFNKSKVEAGAVYLALYDEIFINGQRAIGNGNEVSIFDRNRAYAAIGYAITDNLALQLGYMQQTTNTWDKGQIQLSVHHNNLFRSDD